VAAESLFTTIKRELIDTQAWPTRAGLRHAAFDSGQYEAVHRNADRQAAQSTPPTYRSNGIKSYLLFHRLLGFCRKRAVLRAACWVRSWPSSIGVAE
jgi:hypothetical protein